MPHPSNTMVLAPSSTKTATAAFQAVVTAERFTAAIVMVDVTAASGTTPTLDVKIQQGIAQVQAGAVEGDFATGAIFWDDYAAFAQITATGKRLIRVVGSGEEESAAADGTLTAAQIRNGPLGSLWRVKAVIGGTTPSFTFSVVALFIP